MASARWRIVLDAIASSVTMQPFLSRALVKKGHIVTFARSTVGCAGQWQRLGTAIAKMHANHGQLLRKDGSMSAVALDVCHGSLAHLGWHSSSTIVGVPQLRQSYITPHFAKCSPVATLKLRLVSPTAGAPSRVYKTGVMQNCLRWSGRQSSALPGRSRALRAAVCRPSAVLALWPMSGALRIVFVSGFAVYVVFAPAHPWGLLASQHRPRGLPVRPPRGLPQTRAKTRRVTVVACHCGTPHWPLTKATDSRDREAVMLGALTPARSAIQQAARPT